MGVRSGVQVAFSQASQLGGILAGRSEFLERVRLVSHQVKRVACQAMILVGKWRPNDSFKPNPLRGFGCSSAFQPTLPIVSWRVGLIQVLCAVGQMLLLAYRKSG